MNQPLIARDAKEKDPLPPAQRNLRRKLILQDSLALLTLAAITVCIAILTYFFFHSFREHRSVLEKRWYQRGEEALAAGHPKDAVEAFRSALSLSSSNPTYELPLAEALAEAGRTGEAYAYFSTLHDAEPGDGFLNLQLARLAVRRKDQQQAIDFYRSALNGAWPGQGTEQRLQIRLELAKYLLSLGKTTDAQGELLTAEGNSLDNPSALFEIASLLKQADDPSDALTAYQRVVRHIRASRKQVLQALFAEAQIAVSMGQYKRGTLALDRYSAIIRQHPAGATAEEKHAAFQQQARLQRMLRLIPFYGLQPKQHAQRVLLEAEIAHRRLENCVHQQQSQTQSQDSTSPDAAELSNLGSTWKQIGPMSLRQLAGDAAAQQGLIAWVNQTEITTARICGAPSGDDALLLQLAQVPDKTE